MTVYRTSDPEEAWWLSKKCLAGQEGLIIVTTEVPCVWTGKLRTFNKKYCEEHNVPVAYGEYLGGSIVAFPSDLSIMEVRWGDSSFAQDVIHTVEQWLLTRGLAVTYDTNDLLLDGKKVASWARATTVKGWCQSVVHFSIGTDLELIREICIKPMTKIPGSLTPYGITAEDLLKLLELSE